MGKHKFRNEETFKLLEQHLHKKGESITDYVKIKESFSDDAKYHLVKFDEKGRKIESDVDLYEDIKKQGYQVKLKKLNNNNRYKTPILCGYDRNKVSVGASLDLLAKGRFGKSYFANHFKEGVPIELYNTLRDYLSSLNNEQQEVGHYKKSK